jgi:hypothetical protein
MKTTENCTITDGDAVSEKAALLRALAPGPEKEAWKKSGNRYTSEELDRMTATAMHEVTLSPTKTRVVRAD